VVEAKVTPGGIDISSDLTLLSASGSTYSRIKDALCVSFKNQSSALSATTYPTSLYFNGTDGNLYANDGAGNQIQLTASGAVNSSTTGGITGVGYGDPSDGAVNWDSGSALYHMYADSTAGTYADVKLDDLIFLEPGGGSNTLTLTAQAMGADYTLTFPAAVASSDNTIVQSSATGALSFSNTVGSLTTNSGGVTAAANQHVTVSGTGRFKHGEMQYTMPGSAGTVNDYSLFSVVRHYTEASAANAEQSFPIVVPLGCRITTINWNGENGSAAVVSVLFGSHPYNDTTFTTITSGSSSAGAGDKSVTLSPNTTIADNTAYTLRVDYAASGDRTFTVEVFYDWP
jgi:hypothetical protein